ncbi:MAG: beta-ketoacyl synthase N-terminal-like domain-containing protein [Polyangiales bacterium]
MKPAPRYPITASAACCALGMSRAEILEALYAGRSGLVRTELGAARSETVAEPWHEHAARTPGSHAARRADSAHDAELAPGDAAAFVTALGRLPGELPPLPAAIAWQVGFDTRLGRMAAFVYAGLGEAVTRAVERYGASRVGIVVASSNAGLAASEYAYAVRDRYGQLPAAYDFERSHAFHSVVELLRVLSGAQGPGFVVSTACSSGNKVFGSAQRLLAAGVVDAVLVGGIDTLCEITVRGFHSLGILSTQPCRPFAQDRDGTNIGEGGALFLVERGGQAAVELCGVGEGCDAHHKTQPPPDGAGAVRALHAALADAGLRAGDIDHVNAHGTGTPQNDSAEARALEAVFGRYVPVVSTKAATGHVLGAAAALEALFVIAAIERAALPPSLHADPRDPGVSLTIPTVARPQPCRYVLSNSFAFGGSNACVIFGASA